ncbi:UTP--glucose-1-phosphate uridylyltransferase GalU [Aneurinibacillus terranovensis]|uniref:UTP--glucose-1-phosphate uridylyltransferase GalU n=1 Tax=Aneurinibacillus terranovensis TaxID=278991 RepID=UPI0004214AB0|nr:UTP--glucose-1-phosphate uridylyltransferase GalU [Aneurinibacillus terranovensis]
MKIKKAVIPAAGLGTRFLPATKAQPKEMLPIVDKPVIQYIVEEAVASGIEDIMIVTGRNKRAIEDHFDKSFELETNLRNKGNESQLEVVENISHLANVFYIRQREPLGLGDAIACARPFICGEPFAVLLGDDLIKGDTPCLKQMLELYEKEEKSLVAVQEVEPEETRNYGIIAGEKKIERLYDISYVVEKPKENPPTNRAIIGRYIFEPEVFELLKEAPCEQGIELDLSYALNRLAEQNKLLGYQFNGTRYDAGNKLGFLKATVEFALEREDIGPLFKAYLCKQAEKLRN